MSELRRPVPADDRRSAVIAGIVLAGAVLFTYTNSLHGPFVYDDLTGILGNSTLREWWRIDRVLFPPVDATVGGRPILNLSFAVNHAVSGTAVWSYHALNAAIHALAALALFGLIRRTLRLNGLKSRPRPEGNQATLIAFLIAAVWALHPLNTEAVDYLVQRAESLMSLFLLLTLYCFARGAEAETTVSPVTPVAKRWFVGAFGCCLLGMATKENMAATPLLALLYDRTFVSGTWHEAWRRHARVFLAMAATWILLAGLILSTGGNRGGSVGFGTGVSFTAYWLTQPVALVRYLALAAWPFPLVFDYGTFWIGGLGEVWWQSLVVLAAVVGAVVAIWQNRPVGFLAACFFAILAPTSLMPGLTQMIVEHRMYLPLAAILVLVLPAAWTILGHRRAVSAVALLAAGGAVLTMVRNSVYRQETTLWADTLAKRPENARAYFHLGLGEQNHGRFAEASALYRKAIELFPDYLDAHNNLGNVLCQMGRPDEALADFDTALRLAPNDPVTHANAANAFSAIGRPADARAHYERALQLKPHYREAQVGLAATLLQLGRPVEAIAHFEAALALDPTLVAARIGLAEALTKAGHAGEALAQYEMAVKATPHDATLRAEYAGALADAGRVPEALAQFKEAVRIQPTSPELQFNYGATLLGAGRTTEAIARFETALRLRPDFAAARAALEQAHAVGNR